MNHPREIIFGDGCFGLYHAPEGALVRDVAVVICPTLGYEAVCSHRALRELAQKLAASGIATLRFDYHGTGDSAGHDRLPHRLDAWQASIDAAIHAVRRASHARAVILVGLRLGANLVAARGAERGDLAGVVLFAPCASGKSFVRETRAFRLLAAAQEGYTPPAEADELDAAGFVLTSETIADLTRLLTWPKTRIAQRILVLERDDGSLDSKVRTALEGSGSSVEIVKIAGYGKMMVDPHRTTVPHVLNERIATWIASGHEAIASRELSSRDAGGGELLREAPASTAPVSNTSGDSVLEGDGFTERARWFGARGRLFGIVTEPTRPGARRGTVVLLNPGSVHHIGSNRMHVTWARAWASAGFAVARIDVGGIGESPASSGQPENQTYSQSAVPDVETVMAELGRAPGCGPITLIGICSGGYAAFHVALGGSARSASGARGRPTSVVLINPQTFHFQEGDSLDVNPLTESRHYKKSLVDPEKWKRLLAGKIDLGNGARALFRIAARRIKTEVARRIGAEDVGRELAAIAARIDVLLMYSASDPGLDYLNLHARKALAGLRALPRFQMSIIADADHTFTLVDAQRRLQAKLFEHIERIASRSAT